MQDQQLFMALLDGELTLEEVRATKKVLNILGAPKNNTPNIQPKVNGYLSRVLGVFKSRQTVLTNRQVQDQMSALGIPRDTVNTCLSKLVAMGALKRIDRGMYKRVNVNGH